MRLEQILIACTLLAASAPALAQRHVWVNGQLQSPAQLARLDRASCTYVPNGHYWLNYQTGVWGYRNDRRARGHIADNCRSAHGHGQHRLDRGPFGTYMSDGRCSFVNGVPVGRC